MPRRELVPTNEYPTLRDAVEKLYNIRDQITNLRVQAAELDETIEAEFRKANQPSIVLEVRDHYVILTPDIKFKDKLDKDSLSEQARLEKKELSKPYDYSFWTERGMLTARMIQENMVTEKCPVIKIRKRKKPAAKG